MIDSVTVWLTDWLIEGWTDRQTDRLTDWLTDWLTEWYSHTDWGTEIRKHVTNNVQNVTWGYCWIQNTWNIIMYDAHVYFCLFYSEWGVSTDDCLTMWHVGSGPSTPEVSRQSWCFWWGNWSPPCYKYHTEFVSCTVILLIFQDYTQSACMVRELFILGNNLSRIVKDFWGSLQESYKDRFMLRSFHEGCKLICLLHQIHL